MQNIQITLQDPALEQTILRLTKEHRQNLQDFITAALRHYVKEIGQSLKIPKLDPFQHSHAPTEPFQAASEDTGLVFQDVENSAEFGKKIRQRAWRDE
ncbi:MAG: hypothetical protein GY862_08575 [Gammaproteobacteria bacterium]|nr:hypothetical protein [Gammaproteobacteria bacterium]